MRVVFGLIAALALAACPSSSALDSTKGDDNPIGGGGGSAGALPAQCVVDAECILVGPTCCACPTFALPATDPVAAGCDGVSCPPATCTNNVEASCVSGTCELTCRPLACDATCENGFAVDATGCLTCTCAPADGCAVDTDCHDVGADCCGCALGGSDTAVVDVAAHAAELACPANPQCPGTDTCDASAAVRCIAARCFLLPAADQTVAMTQCGRPDLHPDPANPTSTACPGAGSDGGVGPVEVCVVNANAAASARGTGICRAP